MTQNWLPIQIRHVYSCVQMVTQNLYEAVERTAFCFGPEIHLFQSDTHAIYSFVVICSEAHPGLATKGQELCFFQPFVEPKPQFPARNIEGFVFSPFPDQICYMRGTWLLSFFLSRQFSKRKPVRKSMPILDRPLRHVTFNIQSRHSIRSLFTAAAALKNHFASFCSCQVTNENWHQMRFLLDTTACGGLQVPADYHIRLPQDLQAFEKTTHKTDKK